MNRLRIARHLSHHIGRWVLLWFVLSLGVSIASPIVNPQAIELICSGSGAMKIIVKTSDGSQEVAAGGMDCPLCASTHGGAPPHTDALHIAPPQPLAHAVSAFFSAHITALTSAPMPARGPPLIKRYYFRSCLSR
jgi:hypothetical protein